MEIKSIRWSYAFYWTVFYGSCLLGTGGSNPILGDVLVFRLLGTIRLYIEQYEKDPSRTGRDSQEALDPLLIHHLCFTSQLYMGAIHSVFIMASDIQISPNPNMDVITP